MALARRKAHWQGLAADLALGQSSPALTRALSADAPCVYHQSQSQGLGQTCTYAGKKGASGEL